jgi:hypothetical protein
MDRFHTQWTMAGSCDPPWTSGGTDQRAPECGGALIRAWPSAQGAHWQGCNRERGTRGSQFEPHHSGRRQLELIARVKEGARELKR